MDCLQEPSESDENDEQVAEAAEDIVAHMIHVYRHSTENASAFTKAGKWQKSFSHLSRIDGENGLVPFVPRMQDAGFPHIITASIPKQKFGESFTEILVDTGAARERSSASAQY